MDNGILIGGSTAGQIFLNPRYANRHGLIAGATGTGKTVTLQCLAEGFSDLGVPVFLADIKGDISGMSQPGKPHRKVDERVEKIGKLDIKSGTGIAFQIDVEDAVGVAHQIQELTEIVEDQL